MDEINPRDWHVFGSLSMAAFAFFGFEKYYAAVEARLAMGKPYGRGAPAVAHGRSTSKNGTAGS